MDDPQQLFVDRVRDGSVIYNLATGVYRVAKDVMPWLHEMDKAGHIWPYFVRRIVKSDDLRGEYHVQIEEIPDYKPGTGKKKR